MSFGPFRVKTVIFDQNWVHRVNTGQTMSTRSKKWVFGQNRVHRVNTGQTMSTRVKNEFFFPVDIVWPVLTRWNRFLWNDSVDSRKIYFWIFLFLNFFGIFINNNRNKITFEKITVDPKLGYNNMYFFHSNKSHYRK